MRKPRSDSKLDSLTPQQREQLSAWLTIENRSYAETRALVSEHFGITTSDPALVAFYSRVAAPWKYAQARGEADAFSQLMEGKFDAVTIKRAKQLAFESMSGPRPDIKAAQTLLKIITEDAKIKLQQEKLTHDARRIKLLETKAAQAAMEHAKKIRSITADTSLTTEQKTERVRKLLFGERPGDFAPVTEKGAETA